MSSASYRDSTLLGVDHFTLEELGLVDAKPPEAFDALTRMALKLFNVPVALISIVQEESDRQYFASQQGLPEPWASDRQTPLSHSFCQYVKLGNAPLIVSDARRHDLVQDNKAIDDLNVIAYLGVPIVDPKGAPIGAMCVIQDTEREWSDSDVSTLRDLAQCVSAEVLLRASLAANAAAYERSQRYNAIRERVSLAFMAPDLSIEERFTQLLQAGCSALGLDTGMIAKINGDEADILFSNLETDVPVTGRRLALAGSLAELAVRGQEQVHFHDVNASIASDRQTLSGHRPGCYVGAPLIYDGVLYGVIEMSSCVTKPKPWSNEELSILGIVSMYACANLGVYGRINALKNSEAALLQFLMDSKHRQYDMYHSVSTG